MSTWAKVGLWRFLAPLPPPVTRWQVARFRARIERVVAPLTREHRDVHRFVVGELPRLGRPLPPSLIAERLQIPPDRLGGMLDELEAGKGFLFRDPAGAVAGPTR